MAPRKYRTAPNPDNGGWFEVKLVTYGYSGHKVDRLRVTVMPGRIYVGDYASPDEVSRKVPGLDFADLVPVDGDE